MQLAYRELYQEFEEKNNLLRCKFSPVSPLDYIYAVFPDLSLDDVVVLVFGTVKDKKGNILERGTIKRVPLGDIFYFAGKPNVYMPYATFRKNYYKSETLEKVRAFVVDCDNVDSNKLSKFLEYQFKLIPQPSYIVNSGRGIHFVYLLNTPLLVRGRKSEIRRINEVIQGVFEGFGMNLDRHPVVHPYRFPGFRTKINTQATAFKVREPYTFEELKELFNLKEVEMNKDKTEGKGKIIYFPRGSEHFWNWVVIRLFRYPPLPGRRHNSFFALGIIAYKCRRYVSKEKALRAVGYVYDSMMDVNSHIGFSLKEAFEAFEKGYNQKAIRVRWKYLCDLLGWEYKPNKRNGRKREEHLKLARKIKAIRCQSRWEEQEEHIKRLLEQGYSKRKIAELVGIHYTTLYRRFRHLF